MNFLLRLVNLGLNKRERAQEPNYESLIAIDSKVLSGVRFSINRISFGRRMALSKQLQELARKAEFLDAGQHVDEKLAARILAQEIEALYLRWGLARIEGLTIDGEPAAL